jgi:uncharacterized membrane protein
MLFDVIFITAVISTVLAINTLVCDLCRVLPTRTADTLLTLFGLTCLLSCTAAGMMSYTPAYLEAGGVL